LGIGDALDCRSEGVRGRCAWGIVPLATIRLLQPPLRVRSLSSAAIAVQQTVGWGRSGIPNWRLAGGWREAVWRQQMRRPGGRVASAPISGAAAARAGAEPKLRGGEVGSSVRQHRREDVPAAQEERAVQDADARGPSSERGVAPATVVEGPKHEARDQGAPPVGGGGGDEGAAEERLLRDRREARNHEDVGGLEGGEDQFIGAICRLRKIRPDVPEGFSCCGHNCRCGKRNRQVGSFK